MNVYFNQKRPIRQGSLKRSHTEDSTHVTFSKRQNYSDGKQTSGFARGCGWKAGALWDKGTLLHPAAMHVL